MTDLDREELGKLVREVWVEWALEQQDPKPAWLDRWDDLSERLREVDRRIGSRLAARGVQALLERAEQDQFPQPRGVPLREDNGYLSMTTLRWRARFILEPERPRYEHADCDAALVADNPTAACEACRGHAGGRAYLAHHLEMPAPPEGYAACRTGYSPQVTHLVLLDSEGSNGGRPTMCRLTRFPTVDPHTHEVLLPADIPGWSMGGGVSGRGVVQVACPDCYARAAAREESA